MPRFREDIPLIVIFSEQLGLESDKDICQLVWGSNVEQYETLMASFSECSDLNIYNRNDAI
jgi:hypothetical protein